MWLRIGRSLERFGWRRGQAANQRLAKRLWKHVVKIKMELTEHATATAIGAVIP
jgi:hypothetical protein